MDYSILVLDENGCSLEQAVAYTFVCIAAGITPVSSMGANDASINLG